MTLSSFSIRTIALTLLTSLIFAPSVSAAWVIDLSGTLVDVDELALGGESLSIAQINSRANLEDPTSPRDDSVATPPSVQGRDGEPGPVLRGGPRDNYQDLSLEEIKQIKEKYANQVTTRQQNLEKNKLTIRTRVNAEEQGLTVRQETLNEEGKVVASKDTEIPKAEKLRLEQPEEEPVEISTNKPDEIVLQSTHTRTRTNFPISVGEDNTLMVTRPDGTTKDVAVLPDQAVANLNEKGFVPTADPELTITQDEPVYQLPVKEEKRFLGLFKVVFDKRAEVSAESGEVESELPAYATAWQRFLERFSF